MKNRAEIIIKCFDFLVDEFGYVVSQKEYSPDMMGNAYVLFKSSKVGIEVSVDRDQVLVSIGPVDIPKREWFEFSDVLKYFNPSIEQAYNFFEIKGSRDWDQVIELQASRLASLLQQNCAAYLRGDFEMSPKIKKIEENRIAKMIKGKL